MARTTRIVGPDGGVTTIKSKTTCGCVTFFLFLAVLGIPAAYFGDLAIPAYIGLGLLVVALFSAGVAKAKKEQQAKAQAAATPVGPQGDWADYWAAKRNPSPPPMPPPPVV